ncbi:hypothetical protein [Runella sp.]|uniref:hypothetical protein n=1 Tax=Runella sp. TaxID=1960881 RepID=UPI003016D748
MEKGKTNNPHGRPKGTPNKTTADIRNRVKDFVNAKWETMEADFNQLEPKERLAFFEKLLQYTLPKLQLVGVDADAKISNNNEGFDVTKLSEAELREIVNG